MSGLNDPPRRALDATAALTAATSQARGADETGAATERLPASAAPTLGPPATPGEVGTLGPYRLVRQLGRGGMGAVYAAIDTRLDRRLALKLMLPEFAADPDARERFIREARAAAQVHHDNVVTVFEADVRDGVPYIAMPFLEGYPLDEYLKKKGTPTVPQVLRIGREAAAGLAAAHARGLVHRDIKPANLWLEAPQGRIKLLDFGLAKPVNAEVELTKQGGIVGTPAYMSPEQARGEKVDHRTDLFSLGAVLYRLCAGKLPFDGPSTMAVLIALGTEDPAPVRSHNPAVPESLAALIHQLLAKNPADRPKSADEVTARLRAMAQPATRPAEASQPQVSAASQQQVVYVPIQVTAAPEANPFAELDAPEAEPAPAAERRKTRPVWPVAAGLAALVLAVFGGVIIVIRSRAGTETRIEVPDGATVTVIDKGGKTLAQVGPGGKQPAADTGPDRAAAEKLLPHAAGLSILPEGATQPVWVTNRAELPAGPFVVREISFYKRELSDDFAAAVLLPAIEKLTELQKIHALYTRLSVSGEPLQRLAKAPFAGGLTELTADVDLTPQNLDALTRFPHLTDLKCSADEADDGILQRLSGFPRLRYLKIRSLNKSGRVGPDGWAALAALPVRRLALEDAALGGPAARPLAKMVLDELTLYHTRLSGEAMAELSAATKIKCLRLSWSGLTEADVEKLHAATGYEQLDLCGTGVTDAGMAHLKGLKGLTGLNLSDTGVTDAGLALLKDLKSLTDLHVKNTMVTAKGLADFHATVPGCRIEWDSGLIEDVDRKAAEWVLSIGGTSEVIRNGERREVKVAADLPQGHFTTTAVNLSSKPQVTDAGLAHFKGCNGLWHLDLGDTPVTDAGLANFKDCKGLAHLRLCLTRVTDAGLANFEGCKALAHLNLGNTKLTDAGLAHFRDCKALAGLYLDRTQVTDAGLTHLKGCQELTDLSVAATRVQDAGLAALKDHPRLTGLNLAETQVTDAGLAHIKECKSLAYLGVRNTKVTAKGLADFHAAVPGCRVEYDGGVIEPKK